MVRSAATVVAAVLSATSGVGSYLAAAEGGAAVDAPQPIVRNARGNEHTSEGDHSCAATLLDARWPIFEPLLALLPHLAGVAASGAPVWLAAAAAGSTVLMVPAGPSV